MSRCEHCRFAKWDYEEYSNTPDKAWFVCGCIKDLDTDGIDCEGYEENQNDQMRHLPTMQGRLSGQSR